MGVSRYFNLCGVFYFMSSFVNEVYILKKELEYIVHLLLQI